MDTVPVTFMDMQRSRDNSKRRKINGICGLLRASPVTSYGKQPVNGG